jgi:UDP-glucose 4-epimerase
MYTILVTGGLGYIGAHIAFELLQQDYHVVIADNLSNCNRDKLDKLMALMKIHGISKTKLSFYNIDVCHYDSVLNMFMIHNIDLVIHLAGYKAVGESVKNPLKYYNNNLLSTITLLNVMKLKYVRCRNFIFSSSATVYGKSDPPYKESAQINDNDITNPYGKTKYMQERILEDVCKSNPRWNIISLRYFNPIGHAFEELREDTKNIPNNLFPYIYKVHTGELPQLTIFGDDYDTPDGTCIRDYIHVADLANAHCVACKHILKSVTEMTCMKANRNVDINVDVDVDKGIGYKIYNVGTGKGTSVLDLLKYFNKANNTEIPYIISDRRSGDIARSFADVSLIYEELGWKATHCLIDACRCQIT